MYKVDARGDQQDRSPEKDLYAAIIMRAWADLEWLDADIRNHAWAWIHGESYKGRSTRGVTSFVSCCRVLGLDPVIMRKHVTSRSYTAATCDNRSGTYRAIKTQKEGIRLSL